MRTIYVRPDLSETLPQQIRVIDVPPLLRELLLESVRLGALSETSQVHTALATLLIDQIAESRALGLALPMPTDPRARTIVERTLVSLNADASLKTLTQGLGLSPRTAERLFLKETGMSFGRWRQQARLQHAVRRLAEGRNVTEVALDCGYSSVSAFVAMFKSALGATPGKYLAPKD